MKKIFYCFLFFLSCNLSFLQSKDVVKCKKNKTNLIKQETCNVSENINGKEKDSNIKVSTQFKYVILGLNNCFWKKSLYDLLFAYKKRVKISFWGYLDLLKCGVSFACGILDAKKGYEIFFKYCKKESLDSVTKKCTEIWEQECKNFIYKDAVNIFNDYKKNGNVIIAVDAGIYNLYEELRKIYKFDYFFSSELEFKNGCTTGKLVGNPCSGKEKYEHIKKLIEIDLKGSLKDAVCYANSHNDIYLLERVGKPIAVNPNSKLKVYAKKKGWQILYFKETMVAGT